MKKLLKWFLSLFQEEKQPEVVQPDPIAEVVEAKPKKRAAPKKPAVPKPAAKKPAAPKKAAKPETAKKPAARTKK